RHFGKGSMVARSAHERSHGGRVVRGPGEDRPGFQRPQGPVVHSGQGRRSRGGASRAGATAEFAFQSLGWYKLAASNLSQLTGNAVDPTPRRTSQGDNFNGTHQGTQFRSSTSRPPPATRPHPGRGRAAHQDFDSV